MAGNENKQDTVYDSKQLSKWFAISSILLLIVTIWGLIQDYNRPWKSYQRQAQKIAASIGEDRLKKAQSAIDKGKLNQLQEELAKNEKAMAVDVVEIDAEIKKLSDDYYIKNRKYQDLKGELSADLFEIEKAIEEENSPTVDTKIREMKAAYDKKSKEVDKLGVIADAASAQLDKAKNLKEDILSKQKGLSDTHDKLLKEITIIKKSISDNEANLGNIVRNAPMVDFIAPTIKINQIILPQLKDDYFFNKVARVDRCMTCHVVIDKAGFEDYPEPFRTHPKLKLMVGADSAHPAEKIGCTVCHSGVPQSADFVKSAHVPRNAEEGQEWELKYGYHPDENVKTQMLPLGMVEGQCLQCHAKQTQLEGAPNFNAGMRLIERYGCFNCHKIAGHFERLAKEKKSGPQLNNIASKVTAEWAKKWIWDPKSFRPTTLMPNFWQVHNNSDPASLERSKVEVDSIIYYLFKRATPFEPIKMSSKAVGDASRGKEIVGSVGCLACHAVDDFPRKNPDSMNKLGWKDPRVPLVGPELNQLGSKVTKEWLFSWLTNPKHYWEQTTMPSMKLSEQEAVDVAEYLLSKHNEEFEKLPAPEAKDEVRNKLVLDYLVKSMSPKEAETKLASMSLEDRKDFLGDKFVNYYGCYECHAIKGLENGASLGAELTTEGSKDVSKFAFDNVHIEHISRPQWIYTKIRTPRIWDVGKLRDFEAKAKMPHFGFTNEQAEAIAGIILGQQNKNVDESAMFPVDGRWEHIIEGQRLINRYNCVGCHAIEKKAGHILAFYQDDLAMGPPNLNNEGAKVQPEWLHSYLLNTNVMIRPWIKLRMPNFRLTNDEATTITKYFAAYDSAPYPFIHKANNPLTTDDMKQVQGLFTDAGCLSCHAVRKAGEDVSAAAPHLNTVKARLRPDWVVRWITCPDCIMPGTRMPGLWQPTDPDHPGPESEHSPIGTYFNSNASTQINKMRDFLFQYGGAPELPPEPIHDPDAQSR